MKMKFQLALLLSGICILSSALSEYHIPKPVLNEDKGAYIELMGGAAYQNLALHALGDSFAITQNQNWAWTAGADVGYRLSRYIALELGALYSDGQLFSVYFPSLLESASVSQYNIVGFAATRLQLPLNRRFALFAKLGVAANYMSLSMNTPTYGNSSASLLGFAPLLAAGMKVYFDTNLYMNVQYTYMLRSLNKATATLWGTSVDLNTRLPSYQLMTVALGYNF